LSDTDEERSGEEEEDEIVLEEEEDEEEGSGHEGSGGQKPTVNGYRSSQSFLLNHLSSPQSSSNGGGVIGRPPSVGGQVSPSLSLGSSLEASPHHHGSRSGGSNKRYPCGQCGRSLTDIASLQRHLR